MLHHSGADDDLEDGEIFDEEDGEIGNEVVESKAEPKGEGPTEMVEESVPSSKKEAKETKGSLLLDKKDRKLLKSKKSSKRGRDEELESSRGSTRPRKRRRSPDLDKRSEKDLLDEIRELEGRLSPPQTKSHVDNHWNERYYSEIDSSEKSDEEPELNLEVVSESECVSYEMDEGELESNTDSECNSVGTDEDEEDDDRRGSSSRRGRDSFPGRAGRRMRVRGSGIKGGTMRRPLGRREPNLCRFFAQGKCQKGSECPYSHAPLTPMRKMELCRFYMFDRCSKSDKCLFMHSEFPCKFHHTGLKCFAGKKCKFSHGKITPQLKAALYKHLEQGSLKDYKNDYHHQPFHQRRRESGDYERKERNFDNRHNNDYHNRHHNSDYEVENSYWSYFSEDGNRTPMPSPARENSCEKDPYSSDNDLKHKGSPNPKSQSPEAGDVNNCDDKTDIPPNLPRKQRELFMRIQQQQRKAESSKTENEDGTKEDEFKEDNWYSSDEEGGNSGQTLSSVLNKLTSANKDDSKEKESSPHSLSNVGSLDIDVNAVSKLLLSVRETIQQKAKNQVSPGFRSPPQNETRPPLLPTPLPQQEDPRRARDPRLRLNDNNMDSDIDLRLGVVGGSGLMGGDVDLRHLPFKPVPVHQAATEIDASISSHPPMEYKLLPVFSSTPDYTNVHSKAISDPRIKQLSGVPSSSISKSHHQTTSSISPKTQHQTSLPQTGMSSPHNQGPNHTPLQGIPQHGMNMMNPVHPNMHSSGHMMGGPMQGVIGPMQGGAGPMQGGPMQGGVGPMQGGVGPMQGGVGPMQGDFGPMQGGVGPMQGGMQGPMPGSVQGPLQGGLLPHPMMVNNHVRPPMESRDPRQMKMPLAGDPRRARSILLNQGQLPEGEVRRDTDLRFHGPSTPVYK